MGLKLIIPPIIEPVTREEAKNHCRVETNDDDILISSLIIAAREYCEGFQNRAYCLQTWQLWLDKFPSKDWIDIPRPPLQSVDIIAYYGTDDIPVEFDDYFVDTESEPGRIILNYGKSWPSITLRPANGVCITFTAGYGDNCSDTGNIPQKVKQAILLLVGHWYENREAIGQPNLTDIPKGVDALLWQDRNL